VKIVGICGSPNGKESTSLFGLNKALEAARKQGVETEFIHLADYKFEGCHDCGACRSKLTCSQNDDFTNKLIEKLSDETIGGFIFASPVYFGGITAHLKAFFDRCVTFRRNGFVFEDKVAGAITVGRSRNGGQELAVMDIVKSCMVQGMTIVPDSSPTSHFGGILWSGAPDGVEADDAGVATAQNLGTKVAEVALKLSN